MKTYHQNNFFKHTFCEFLQVDDFDFPKNTHYKSKSDSYYFYTEDGVYRKSNHWGRVANCRWKLISNENYKNQKTVIGFAKWSDFYPINSSEKIFSIKVDFELKTTRIQINQDTKGIQNFTFNVAQKRVKQIHHLFKNNQWANYFDEPLETLQEKIITEFINSNKTLQEIKRSFK